MKKKQINLSIIFSFVAICIVAVVVSYPKNSASAEETCLRFSHFQSGNYIETTTGNLYCCHWDEQWQDFYSVGQEVTCTSGGNGCGVYYCDTGNPDLICETTPDPNCDYTPIPDGK